MMYTLENTDFSFRPREWPRPSGEKMTYFDEGPADDDEAMVFIHGLGNNAVVWFKMIQALAPQRRCIAVDLPGHGASTTSAPLSIAYMAQSVSDLLDHLQLKSIVLTGHSMGGQIAARIALQYPNRINRLVLLAPAGFETFSPKEKSWLKSIYATWLLKKLSKQRMTEQFRENFFHFDEDARFFLEDLRRLRESPSAFQKYCENLSACMHAMLDEPIFDDLPHLTVPTLVIYGENDAIIPNPVLHPEQKLEEVARAGSRQIPEVTLKMLPSCGHMLQWEKTEAIVRLIHPA